MTEKDDLKTIKNCYRKMCFQYHPDRASGMYEEKFKTINDAYQVLGDEAIRARYDRARAEAKDPKKKDSW